MCPICGQLHLLATIFGHVGGERCRARYAIAGAFADPDVGPEALELAIKLAGLLRPSSAGRRAA